MTTAISEKEYLKQVERTRVQRMKWWHDARFGMFIHWGLYAQIGRNEWAMNLERIPVKDYEKLAATWKPKPRPMREWAALAKRAGMKYMVMTTKHHEGFLLWDSAMSDYNAVQHGPGRDLVREYVEACREFGLKVGFYYSLMDWHHPDGAKCATNEAARQRFIDYTQGCVRELMSNYGKIDILWYDVSWPLTSPEAWDSYRMNAMVRKLQPHIIINDRSQVPEDLGTPEEHINPAKAGRAWEACMTFNGSWGWQKAPPEDWRSVRGVLEMLRTCAANQGNLLLNIGPLPDGTVPKEAVTRLTAVGKWLDRYGDVIYGKVDRSTSLVSATGNLSRKGKTYYFWCARWPGRELAIGALTGKLQSAKLHGTTRKLPFSQIKDRLVIRGLPAQCPDKVAGVAVLDLVFKSPPNQVFSCGCVTVGAKPKNLHTRWHSAHVETWKVSNVMRKKGDVSQAPCVRLADSKLGWHIVKSCGAPEGFISIHDSVGDADGIVYFANRFAVDRSGDWKLHLGHDGGARVFVDGRSVLCEPMQKSPALPGRSEATVSMKKGTHEIVVAFDTNLGRGWGIFLCFEVAKSSRRGRKPSFPRVV